MLARAIERAGLAAIAAKVAAGERLDRREGIRLYESPDLNVVGHLANQVRERLNGNRAWWVRNQHINYTNICNKGCLFCSFYALPKDAAKGYTMTPEQVAEKVRAYLPIPISEVHMVGGVNPKLPYDYYLDLLRAIRAVRPQATIKAYTMVEVEQIARVGKVSLEECLRDLQAAGLDILPGGGAEVFSERVHEELFWAKGDSVKWIDIARTAHRLGIKSNATLLYGHVEQTAEKVDHLLRLRELQDDTGGLNSFIPLSFHPERTQLEHLPAPTGIDDLREVSVARLLLDNVQHIKSFWIMNTIQVTQAALWYGADDTDGTIQEYEITRDPVHDRRQVLTNADLCRLIREAGREPVERDALYRPVAPAAEAAG
ncbi:MAG: CofH family radical SAM protein [Fimbriimonadaceae bacterium]|nr:CofH family radical SAM protein [Fimbriimonadaceae bacterium]